MTVTTVTTMAVEEILANLLDSVDSTCPTEQWCSWHSRCPAYSFDLPDLVNRKLRDYVTPALLEKVLLHGFTVPIALLKRPQGYILGNGNHRFALALVLGTDYLPVAVTDGNDYMLNDLTGETGESHQPVVNSWDDYTDIAQEWKGIFNHLIF